MSPLIYNPCFLFSFTFKIFEDQLVFTGIPQLHCGFCSYGPMKLPLKVSLVTFVAILSGHFSSLLGLTSRQHLILLTRYFWKVMAPGGRISQVPRLTTWKGIHLTLKLLCVQEINLCCIKPLGFMNCYSTYHYLP